MLRQISWAAASAMLLAVSRFVFAMASAMAASIVAIRDVEGQIAVRSLYCQLYVRIFPARDPVGSEGLQSG